MDGGTLSPFCHYISIQLSSSRFNLRKTTETATVQSSFHGLVNRRPFYFFMCETFLFEFERDCEKGTKEYRQQLHTLCMGSLIMFPAVNSGARRAAKRSTITIGTEPHANIEVENHAIIFSWSTWLATRIAGACALRRRNTTTARDMASILQ